MRESGIEKFIFQLLFFELGYLLTIYFPSITFHINIENVCMEGTMSQIVYIGSSFYFMKSRKIIMKKL